MKPPPDIDPYWGDCVPPEKPFELRVPKPQPRDFMETYVWPLIYTVAGAIVAIIITALVWLALLAVSKPVPAQSPIVYVVTMQFTVLGYSGTVLPEDTRHHRAFTSASDCQQYLRTTFRQAIKTKPPPVEPTAVRCIPLTISGQ